MKPTFHSIFLFVLTLAQAIWAAPPAQAGEAFTYKTVDTRELKIFIEKPTDWKATDQRPAIVFFFGGGWVGGTPQQFLPQSEYFAKRGVVGIRVEYRTIAMGDKGPPLMCCADAKSAMRYVRGHATELGVDPARIAAAGGSAGGHLAAFTAMVAGLDDPADDAKISCKPNALLLFNPVFNNGPGQWGHERVGARFREFSPAHNITKAAPPTCVFLGDADKLIGVTVLREFEMAMKTAGVRCDPHVYPGAAHGFFNKEPHKSQTLAEADKFLTSLGWLAAAAIAPPAAAPAPKPNIVFILADDLGYGDARCYNAQSKIPTPHLDRLAREGMRFTDAHSPASVCSPTRYALLTGRYAWRSPLQRGVLGPWDAPIIAADRLTVPALLRQYGYATGIIGKWHLGLRYTTKDGQPAAPGADKMSNVDFSKPIADGPTARGFDHYFGVNVPNYPPYCFIENDRTVGIPSVRDGGEADGINMPGPMLPGWKLVDILPELTRRTEQWIATAGKASKSGKPFFLYLPLTSPHFPVVPAPEFKAQSQAGDYGDFVVQTDHFVGRVLAALEQAGVADDTLIIFTSDNGPETAGEVKPGAYDRIQKHQHASMGALRGVKRDLWEGGHRVPFLARWPGKIPAAAVSDETICHVDFMATIAALLDAKLPPDAGEDSFNLLPVLRGEKPARPVREATVHHGVSGRFAIRQGDWVLIEQGTGDDNRAAAAEPAWRKKERGYEPDESKGQLYNLRADPAQKTNLHATEPARVSELQTLLDRYRREGRSTPGPSQKNDPPRPPAAKPQTQNP